MSVMPTPMLKVLNISSLGDLARLLDVVEQRGGAHVLFFLIRAQQPFFRLRGCSRKSRRP